MSVIHPTPGTPGSPGTLGVPAPPAAPEQNRLHGDNYINHGKGVASWLLTVDHKRIGLMYMVFVLFFFFVGGMGAILLRTELIAPGPTLMFWAQRPDADQQQLEALQPAVHDPRRGDGVPLHHPGDPGDPG